MQRDLWQEPQIYADRSREDTEPPVTATLILGVTTQAPAPASLSDACDKSYRVSPGHGGSCFLHTDGTKSARIYPFA